MEAASPDSPWPEKPLRPFERIMPGFWVPLGDARVHINWSLPDLSEPDMVVLSTFASVDRTVADARHVAQENGGCFGVSAFVAALV